jgi:hypothetical protein
VDEARLAASRMESDFAEKTKDESFIIDNLPKVLKISAFLESKRYGLK